jgi:hypothetical protein
MSTAQTVEPLLPTSSINETQEKIKEIGFFHATGLVPFNAESDEESCPIQAPQKELGRWGYNRRWIIAILENGEVWLRAHPGRPNSDIQLVLTSFLKGPGVFFPFSDHAILNHYHVALRVADSYDNCEGCTDPTPRPYLQMTL